MAIPAGFEPFDNQGPFLEHIGPVHVRRGPWGVLQAGWPEAERAPLRLGTLAELPARLPELEAAFSRAG